MPPPAFTFSMPRSVTFIGSFSPVSVENRNLGCFISSSFQCVDGMTGVLQHALERFSPFTFSPPRRLRRQRLPLAFLLGARADPHEPVADVLLRDIVQVLEQRQTVRSPRAIRRQYPPSACRRRARISEMGAELAAIPQDIELQLRPVRPASMAGPTPA